MKASITTLLASASLVLASPIPNPTPPGIPSSSSARTLLAGLTVASPQDTGTYDRDLFPHWHQIGNNCDSREYVLKRDGQNVQVNNACNAESGTWVSPYDGATWTMGSDLDIDHMVPLKNAWISGASQWTTAKRESFANDVTRPQLWAVTDNVNQSKGDRSPDEWLPPLQSFYCVYAKSWVEVKSYWDLTITSDEKSTLGDMLDTC